MGKGAKGGGEGESGVCVEVDRFGLLTIAVEDVDGDDTSFGGSKRGLELCACD